MQRARVPGALRDDAVGRVDAVPGDVWWRPPHRHEADNVKELQEKGLSPGPEYTWEAVAAQFPGTLSALVWVLGGLSEAATCAAVCRDAGYVCAADAFGDVGAATFGGGRFAHPLRGSSAVAQADNARCSGGIVASPCTPPLPGRQHPTQHHLDCAAPYRSADGVCHYGGHATCDAAVADACPLVTARGDLAAAVEASASADRRRDAEPPVRFFSGPRPRRHECE